MQDIINMQPVSLYNNNMHFMALLCLFQIAAAMGAMRWDKNVPWYILSIREISIFRILCNFKIHHLCYQCELVVTVVLS